MKRKIGRILFAAVLIISLGMLSIAAAANETDAWNDFERNQCTFTYAGKQYTLVFGDYDENVDSVGPESGSAWPVDAQIMLENEGDMCEWPRGPYAVTIFENFGEEDQAEVSAELRAEIIKSVAFSAESKDATMPMVAKIESENADSRWYASFYMNYYQSAALFHANVTLADGCTDAKGNSLEDVRVSQHINVDIIPGDVWINCADKGIDTQEELQALLDTLADAYPASSKILNIMIDLAPVDYGDIIFRTEGLNCNGVVLTGASENENGVYRVKTTMSSLTITQPKLPVVGAIKFIADDDSDTGISITNGKVDMISGCSFYGYDTAVEIADNGRIWSCDNSLFNECNVGFDCSFAANASYDEFQMYNCAFKDCKTGVELTGFPDSAIAYYYRIYHCDFINDNSGNQDIRSDGKVYASGNYFDHAKEKNDKADVSLRYLSPSGLTNYLMYLHGYSETPVSAPDWSTNMIGIGTEADHVELDKSDDTIFADGLLLDANSFERDTELTMDVVEEDGSVTCTWIFENESEGVK